jgi:hypothetical protein
MTWEIPFPNGPAIMPSRRRLAQLREQYFTLRAVIDRCERKDACWQEPAANIHYARHWTDLVRSHAADADVAASHGVHFEDKMLDIAALALAALENSRRRRGATWQEELLLPPNSDAWKGPR